MSTEQFNRKVEKSQKLYNALKKDLAYRMQLQRQNKPVFQLDAQIRGSIKQIEELQFQIQQIYNNFKSNPNDFGLTNRELEKRGEVVNLLKTNIVTSKHLYDSFFEQKKSTKNQEPQKIQKYQAMNKGQLIDEKQKQQKQQQELLDQMIGVVKNTKKGNKDISQELSQQDQQLNELGNVMDLNMQKMGSVKRGMMKLLDGSSNACLIIAIILEIVSLICLILFW